MNEILPIPCERCQASGLFAGLECEECRGKGYAIKAKHKVPNGGRQICILPIGVVAGDQVGQGLPAPFSDLS
jgi:hypothetical protein